MRPTPSNPPAPVPRRVSCYTCARDQRRPSEVSSRAGSWTRRNLWLVVRPHTVFTFGASTTANDISYGLGGKPIPVDTAELEEGQLVAGVLPGAARR